MSNFEQAVQVVLAHEGGGLVPDDNGHGPSRWGVTLETYEESYPEATAADIDNLTQADAAAFYFKAFWVPYHAGLIDDQTVATKVFDLQVNMGPGTAIRILQQACGATPDGVLGPLTAQAANEMDPEALLARIQQYGAAHYEAIVAANPNLAGDLPGWLARLNS